MTTTPRSSPDADDDADTGDEPQPTWNVDIAGRLAHTTTAITEFQHHIARLTLLRAHLLSARDGTLTATWRDNLSRTLAEPDGLPPAQHQARVDAATELANLPSADWEPDRGVGWRASLDAWFEAIKQCLTDTDDTEQRLRTQTGINLATSIVGTAIDRDLATASYRAGMAAAGLDVDWYDWLLERVHQWPDKQRRSYQLDLMTLEPTYRESVEQLPSYWR